MTAPGLAGLGAGGAGGQAGGGGGPGGGANGQQGLATLSGTNGSLQLAIIAFSFGLNSQIETAQLHTRAMYYPIKVLQDDFTFTVHFRSEQAYRQAQDFIQGSMKQLTTQQYSGEAVLSGQLHLSWPQVNIDYQGFIKQSPMGAKKFDFAPKVSYTMILTQDSVYSSTYNASQVPAFNNIYGQNTLDSQAAVGGAESAIHPPPPPAPAPTPPVAAPGG